MTRYPAFEQPKYNTNSGDKQVNKRIDTKASCAHCVPMFSFSSLCMRPWGCAHREGVESSLTQRNGSPTKMVRQCTSRSLSSAITHCSW